MGNSYTLAGLLLGVYAVGLTRAWQLLGARRYGLSSWLSPLQALNQTTPIKTREENRTPDKQSEDEISQTNR